MPPQGKTSSQPNPADSANYKASLSAWVRRACLTPGFIDAILRGRKPKVGVIDGLNMTVPGCYAQLSAMKNGETLKIPQLTL